jgi:hypothetical protein
VSSKAGRRASGALADALADAFAAQSLPLQSQPALSLPLQSQPMGDF